MALHTGFVPKGGGVHNYPTPVTDIDRFRHDDFVLWVTDAEGQPAAVVPVAPRGSGDWRVRFVHSTAGTKLGAKHREAEARGKFLELGATHALARQAFAKQRRPPWPHTDRTRPVEAAFCAALAFVAWLGAAVCECVSAVTGLATWPSAMPNPLPWESG